MALGDGRDKLTIRADLQKAIGKKPGDLVRVVLKERLERGGTWMSAAEIDEYLEGLDEPKRSTLSRLRRDILAMIPDAEQCLSYAVPAFKVAGRTVAGFAAFKNHLSYLPHSGSVFPELSEELAGYEKSSGALRFPVDQPLPAVLVEKLIDARMRQAFPSDDAVAVHGAAHGRGGSFVLGGITSDDVGPYEPAPSRGSD
jgi:uncharacterized protein YdhG (YjbR/CyaY superfamily)